MFSSFTIFDAFFLILGLGFVLVPVVHEYRRGDASAVLSAEKHRNKIIQKVKWLRATLAGNHAKYAQTYKMLRSRGKEVISKAKASCERYRDAAQRNARFPFDPAVPDFVLPQELAAEEPPPPPEPPSVSIKK
jgi:hypothetical protein